MRVFNYPEKGFVKKASNAIYNGDSIKVIVKGWRVKALEKSFPLFMKYFFLDEREKKKVKFYQVWGFIPLMFVNCVFWGFVFTALGMKAKVDYYKDDENLIVLFQKEDHQPYEELIQKE